MDLKATGMGPVTTARERPCKRVSFQISFAGPRIGWWPITGHSNYYLGSAVPAFDAKMTPTMRP